MVIDENVAKKFKEYFNLNFERYRHDGYSAVRGKDQLDMMKIHDYMLRKYKFYGSLIQCIEDNYGKECREWYEKTFLDK